MRLIDADALHFDKIWKKYGRLNDSVVACEILVEDAPTVDAVEIVRCKDCKWWEGCRMLDDDNGYCSDGERKEE